MSYTDTWAVAALAIVDAAGAPLLLRTYNSPEAVLNDPRSPLQAHLYVGPADIIKLHFLLFSSLDRCEERWAASKKLTSSSPVIRGGLTATSRSTREGTGGTSPGPATGNGSAAQPRLVTSTTDIRYMGKLIHSYRFQSHGFCSTTGIKTILATVGTKAPQDAIVPLCRAIYECASAALCNPFHTAQGALKAQQSIAARTYAQLLHQKNPEDHHDPMAPSSQEGYVEHSFPRPAPTPENLLSEPTLGMSSVFNSQLAAILSSFTVTARSVIVD